MGIRALDKINGSHLYILDEQGKPVQETDILRWAEWMEQTERHVAEDYIGSIRISTVFLGLDHSFIGGTPVLYETMIFGAQYDGYQRRYHTRDEALRGHSEALLLAKGGIGVDNG